MSGCGRSDNVSTHDYPFPRGVVAGARELEDRPGKLGELATAVGLPVATSSRCTSSGSRRRRLGDRRAPRPRALGGRPGDARRRDPARGHPLHAAGARRRGRARRSGDDGAGAGPHGRRHRGSAPSAVATLLRARLVDPAAGARRGTCTRCGSAPGRCGWGGRGRSPRRSCRGRRPCWSSPPSSRCGCPPIPRAEEKILLLRDGSEVRLRPVNPSDSPLVAALHARCSPAARRSRFLSPPRGSRPASWRRCSAPDSGQAVLALTADGGSAVGVANLDPDGPGAARISVLVETPGRAVAWAPR